MDSSAKTCARRERDQRGSDEIQSTHAPDSVGGRIANALPAAALAFLPDAAGVLSAYHDSTGAVVDLMWQAANPAAERLLGTGPLAGRRLHGDSTDSACPALFSILVDALRRPVERTVTARRGVTPMRWRVSATPVQSGPTPAALCVTLVDLGPTPVPAHRAAESADKVKREFLAQVSHELRTPLNAILGFSELLLSEPFGPLGSPRYRGYATDIREAGSHLLALVDDLLELSNIDAGRATLAEDAIDLAVLSRQVMGSLEPSAAEGHVTLHRDVPADLPLLRGDASAIGQMLTNLLSNAVTFTPPGGRAVLTARVMPDGGIGLMVADTGVGIPVDDLSRVLQPFERSDSTIARNSKGVGLGLPIVKRLVEIHEGRLELISETGSGTSAVLVFPASRSLPRAMCGPARPPTSRSPSGASSGS
ncbi:sensor histidine kinase [Azospirillum picis]|uniref:histidine kinase n=1 Tax=Azospirillum picis TaxID=488438 RepID=A0ABU0MF70_9PROT|nr:ATP-binding protein [Azospirillum picis]MBP2298234.1 two-component system cell cycle sensor histidine kinase PleC [Azospirillum picis]MDQ0532072.1 two-component system cell cycle sensor histidine kinase PleC [Azospirillum picis]